MEKWIKYGILVVAIVGVVFGYVNLPKTVQALDEKIEVVKEESEDGDEELKDTLQKFMATSEKSMAIQTAMLESERNSRKEDKEEQSKRESLLIQLIQQNREK